MRVWPFAPRAEMIEALEWRTELMRPPAAEQRVSVRVQPRRQWNFSHVLSHQQHAAARAIVRAAASFLVPDWTLSSRPGPVLAGSSVAIAIDTTDLDVVEGGQMLIWQSSDDWELVQIESLSPGEIVAAEVESYRPSPRVLPVVEAVAPGGLEIQRPAGPVLFADITFDVVNTPDIAASDYAQYRGHDVLPVCPIVGDGQFDEGIVWPVEVIDNDIGTPHILRERDTPDDRFMMRWHEFGRPAVRRLREWLHSRRGRQKAFWRSTWARDLVPAAAIGAADLVVKVFAPSGVTDLGRDDIDIEIRAQSGVSYYRRVTDVQTSAPVDGRPVLALSIDSALGVALTAAAIRRISFLRCVRFDADRTELLHRAGAGTAVAVACIEVPVP